MFNGTGALCSDFLFDIKPLKDCCILYGMDYKRLIRILSISHSLLISLPLIPPLVALGILAAEDSTDKWYVISHNDSVLIQCVPGFKLLCSDFRSHTLV